MKILKTAAFTALTLANGNQLQVDSNGNLGYFVGGVEQWYLDPTGNMIILGSTAPASAQRSFGAQAAALDLSGKTGDSLNFRVNGSILWALNSGGVPSTSHGVSLTGEGYPAIVARVVAASQTTTQTNVINYLPGASAQKYVMFVEEIITAETGAVTPTIGFKDASGTARTVTVLMKSSGGATSVAPAAVDIFSGNYAFSIDNSNTAITLTYTVAASATFWPSATLMRVN